ESRTCCGPSDNRFYCLKERCGCCICWKSAPTKCFWGGCGNATPDGYTTEYKCPSFTSFKPGYTYC
ncbi:MAG TPA: hypothetical protein VJ201_08320, partial [Candidatus Babeliales bacterium]|nr:hypothetical protein [Candidatus Babeliales bacterium]